MQGLTLVLGNKNYSSWSLRAWTVAKRSGARFEEVVIPLGQPDSASRKLEHSPAGKVPVLHDGELTVWDSLAICEYLAERFPAARLWPADAGQRAAARAVSNEMHAGFPALRSKMPMNVRASLPGRGRSAEVERDIGRVLELWRDLRGRHAQQGEFLFGAFSIADAMFAPVAFRFATYGVDLGEVEGAYARTLLTQPELVEWAAAAREEPWSIPEYDAP